MLVGPAHPRDKQDQHSGQCYWGRERRPLTLLATERPPAELVARGPPQEVHPFLFMELVMMEPVRVRQEIVRMCPGRLGGF